MKEVRRWKRKRRHGPIKRFAGLFTSKGRVINRRQKLARTLKKRLSSQVIEYISMERGKERALFVKKEIDPIIEGEIEKIFKISQYKELRIQIEEDKIKLTAIEASKLLRELDRKVNELPDLVNQWDREIAGMPREIKDYKKKHMQLRELKHLYTNVMLPHRIKLGGIMSLIREKYSGIILEEVMKQFGFIK